MQTKLKYTHYTRFTALVVSAVFIAGAILSSTAFAATGTVSQTTTGASLTITTPANTALDPLTVQATNATLAGTVTGVAPSDLRGTGAGWTVTTTSTHLTLNAADMKKQTLVGAAGISLANVTVTGTYDGGNPAAGFSGTGSIPTGRFKLKVASVAGTPAKPATVDITKPDGATSAAQTVTANAITVNGFTVTFGGTDAYAVNDEFGFITDLYAYGQLTVSPVTLAGTGTPAAATTNVTLGSAGALAGAGTTSNARTDLTAATNAGLGGYTFNDGLSWVTHSNSLAGGYTATLTYTIA